MTAGLPVRGAPAAGPEPRQLDLFLDGRDAFLIHEVVTSLRRRDRDRAAAAPERLRVEHPVHPDLPALALLAAALDSLAPSPATHATPSRRWSRSWRLRRGARSGKTPRPFSSRHGGSWPRRPRACGSTRPIPAPTAAGSASSTGTGRPCAEPSRSSPTGRAGPPGASHRSSGACAGSYRVSAALGWLTRSHRRWLNTVTGEEEMVAPTGFEPVFGSRRAFARVGAQLGRVWYTAKRPVLKHAALLSREPGRSGRTSFAADRGWSAPCPILSSGRGSLLTLPPLRRRGQ